jgi:hypothetical protein
MYHLDGGPLNSPGLAPRGRPSPSLMNEAAGFRIDLGPGRSDDQSRYTASQNGGSHEYSWNGAAWTKADGANTDYETSRWPGSKTASARLRAIGD